MVEYEYDAWGNCTVTKDTNTIALDNPIRYRGYYYDVHLDLYYLQSRFYDANTGRFINADEPTLIGANGGVVSNNLFAYCDNNPVNKADPSGHFVLTATLVIAIVYIFAEILLCYSIYVNYDSWVKFCTAVGNGLSSAWSSMKKGFRKLNDWSYKKLKSLKSAIKNYIEVLKIEIQIPNSLKTKDKKRVDLGKFKTKLKGSQGKKGPGKWRIEPDHSKHGPKRWKLFKDKKRIASLDESGHVVGK